MPKESHPNSRKNLIFCRNPIQMKTVDDNLHGEVIQKWSSTHISFLLERKVAIQGFLFGIMNVLASRVKHEKGT